MKRIFLGILLVVLCLSACSKTEPESGMLVAPATSPPVTPTALSADVIRRFEIETFQEAIEETMNPCPISEKATVLSNGDVIYIENSGNGYTIYMKKESNTEKALVFQDKENYCHVYQITSNDKDEVFFSTSYGLYQYIGAGDVSSIFSLEELGYIEILSCTNSEIIYIVNDVFGSIPSAVYEYDFNSKTNIELYTGEILGVAYIDSCMSDFVYSALIIENWDIYILLSIEKPGEDARWSQDDYEFYISGDSRYALFYNEKEKNMDLVNLQTHKIITIKDCADELEEIIDQHFFLSDTTLTFFRGKSVETYDILTHEIKRINTLNLDGEDIFYYGFDHGIMGEDGNTVYWNVLEGVGPDEEEINQIADWWVVAYHIDTNEITVLEHHDERPYVWTDGPEWYYFWEKWRDRIVLLSYRTGTSDYNIEYEINQN